MVLFLSQGYVSHSYILEPHITIINVDNLSPQMNAYELRVAGIRKDGTVGAFSSSLRVDKKLSGE